MPLDADEDDGATAEHSDKQLGAPTAAAPGSRPDCGEDRSVKYEA